jgi:NAD-dependent glycerol-3-phosphate dehydrogenase C-terminus
MIGLAGTGDLVATALAPQSRNRRAGELLARGVPAGEIPGRIGQAVESLDLVPLLAGAPRCHHRHASRRRAGGSGCAPACAVALRCC